MAIVTKTDAVVAQAKEELAHRPRAFFRWLRDHMEPADFNLMMSTLLANYEATRTDLRNMLPPDPTTLPEGDWEDPAEEPEP